jgi:hypothetical protein
MKRLAAILFLGGLALCKGGPVRSQSLIAASEENEAPSNALFLQSAGSMLEGEFTGREISFPLVDARTGNVAALRWDNAGKPSWIERRA